MADSTLVQFRLPNKVKEGLQMIANYKGLTLSSFLKMMATVTYREEQRKMYTENGLTVEEENEILQRSKEMEEAYKRGELKFKSGPELLKELHANS